jgi:hypothetical protein
MDIFLHSASALRGAQLLRPHPTRLRRVTL